VCFIIILDETKIVLKMRCKLFILCLFSIASFKQVLSQSLNQNVDTTNNCELGITYFSNYQFKQAITFLNKCYQKDTNNIECLKKIALSNYKLGMLKEAKKNYFNILDNDSSNLIAINQLAVIYSTEGKYNKSIHQYKKLILLDSTNSFYYKQIGFLFFKMGELENSIHHLERAANINSNDITIITKLSNIYLKLKLYSKAKNMLEKGLALDATNIHLLSTKTKIVYDEKDYKSVVNVIDQILQIQKDTSVYMMKLLGISYFHLEKYKKSISTLEKAIKNEQESEAIYYYLGLAYRINDDFEKSVYYFEQAINKGITDNISTYYTNLAITYEEDKNFQESIKAYQAAYKSSKNKILLYHLARNYDSYYKNKKTALHYYEKYLALNDTGNIELKGYAKHRITELKKLEHFNHDTLR